MNDRQKGAIVTLLRDAERNRDYTNHYWFPYKDYLDPTDAFTDFACERLEGKQGYTALIDKLLGIDGTAKIFVEVYGLEENHEEQCITAETLIIFSKASLDEIKQIFYAPEDIFPSDIGEETDFPRSIFLIGANGEQIPGAKLFGEDCFIYYCWWD